MQHERIIKEWAATKLMGQNHWCRGWLAALLAADTDLLGHILEQDSGYPHYLCLINMYHERLPYNDHKELAAMLRHTPRKQMLKAVLDPCPDGLLGALKKLPKRPMSRQGYARLLTLMGDHRARKFLSHDHRASRIQLQLLEKLPPELRDCPVIAHVKNKEHMDGFLECIEAVHGLAPIMSYADIALSLRHTPSARSQKYCSVYSYPIISWYETQLAKKDFPAPPWPGNEWLTPITSGRQLRHVGRTMHNCVGRWNYLLPIIHGEEYFYVTSQAPKVVILIGKHKAAWRLLDVAGERNKGLGKKNVKYIFHKMQKAGFDALESRLPQRYEYERDMLNEDFQDDYNFECYEQFCERQIDFIGFEE